MKYTQTDRSIYKFPNATLSHDPLELRRNLIIHTGGKLTEWIQLYNNSSTELEHAQAEENLITAARKSFTLPRINEKGGVNDQTVLNYLGDFLEWLSSPLEQPINFRPTSQPCTDCPPPT